MGIPVYVDIHLWMKDGHLTYESKKLSSKFPTKDITKFHHPNNAVYYGKCPNEACPDDYIGECDRRIEERIIDHNDRDKSLHILIHSQEKGHHHVWDKDFTVLGSNYRSTFKRKISEAIFTKQSKPSLNKREQSIKLNLYN